MNEKELLRLPAHIIFRKSEDGFAGLRIFVNKKERTIYVLMSLGNNTLIYFIYPNKSYKGEYLLENIIGTDLVPNCFIEGKIVHDHGCIVREIIIAGPAENGYGSRATKINPYFAPMVKDIHTFTKPIVERYEYDDVVRAQYPDLWEESQKTLATYSIT